MHNLEQLIADWRKTMATGRSAGRETFDKLENHRRESVAFLNFVQSRRLANA